MQLVINIPVELYEANIRGLEAGEVWDLRVAVKNGTPLPKGHGDLVDRNDLLEYTDINRSAYIPVINRYEIITAPTIIEADKETDDYYRGAQEEY